MQILPALLSGISDTVLHVDKFFRFLIFPVVGEKRLRLRKLCFRLNLFQRIR